ncbi:peptidase A1 family protein [Abortiporus biennis]
MMIIPVTMAHHLQNIFSLYPNISNFMTMQLSRSGFGMVDGGVFTIGEIDPNYTAIANSPKLQVISHGMWFTLVDGMLINGTMYSGHGNSSSVLEGLDPSSLVAVLDSGTSLVSVPPYYTDLIYKDIPRAEPFAILPGYYKLPCDTKLNVSVVFFGQEYLIHPLDLMTIFTYNGTDICLSTFLSSNDSDKNMNLGDSFMRNIYTLFNFGNFTRSSDENPYIQLLSVTDKDVACITNNIQSLGPAVARNVTSDDSTAASTSPSPNLHTLLRNSDIIIGMLVIIAMLLLVVMVLLVRNQMKVFSRSNLKGYNAVSNLVGPLDRKTQFTYDTPYHS